MLLQRIVQVPGKATMLLAFAAHFAAHDLEPLTFYATESNAMAQEVYGKLCTIVDPSRVLLLATEESGSTLKTHGEVFLETLASEYIQKEIPILEIMDHILSLLQHDLRRARAKQNVDVENACILLCARILALRHGVLFHDYYYGAREYQI